MSRYWVGTDIGGTFTDLFAIDLVTGRCLSEKVLTDHADPTRSVEAGLRRLVEQGMDAAEVERLLHATTLVTNAVLQRRGGRTALLVTEGFRDAVEIGTEHRFDLYDLTLEKPRPLVPRRLRLPIRERMRADGSVAVALDEAQAAKQIGAALAEGVESIAVCLHHAYRNPAHERALGEVIRRLAPKLPVSLSSEVAPEIREYQRASTVSMNAYVAPVVAPYIAALERRVGEVGIAANLLIMQSNGGTVTAEAACAHPVRLLESGPAAGAIGAAHIGRRTGRARVLSFDMGGTTAKAYVIDDAEPLLTRSFETAHVHRFKKGSGLPVQVPAIDMIEIGAGGGSIAHIDCLGLLKVGPESAESEPGPACYGLGGTRPTVTDADLVLGYVGADSFLGGRMRLDEEAARRAIHDHLAAPLKMSVEEAAWGIHRVVNENMAAAARMHLLERGRTPGDYSMVAFGGAGPTHAYGVAQALRLGEIIVPRQAGVGSAYGLLCAPVSFETARSLPVALDAIDWPEIKTMLDEMANSCRRMVAWAGVPAEEIELILTAEMRLRGQGHEIAVSLDGLAWPAPNAGLLAERFRAEYRRLNAFDGPEAPIDVLTWRCTARGPTPELPATQAAAAGAAAPRRRRLYFDGGFVEALVLTPAALAGGAAVAGPAVIELGDANVVVGPGSSAAIGADGLIFLTLERQA